MVWILSGSQQHAHSCLLHKGYLASTTTLNFAPFKARTADTGNFKRQRVNVAAPEKADGQTGGGDKPMIYEQDESLFDDDLDYYPTQSTRPSRSAWIGKGVAGIPAWARDVTPGPPTDSDSKSTSSCSGFHVPSLIQRQGRPVSPTLYMSKNNCLPSQPGSSVS